jgi:hypothetical protein
MSNSVREHRFDNAGGIHRTGPRKIHARNDTGCLPDWIKECEKREGRQIPFSRPNVELVAQQEGLGNKVFVTIHGSLRQPGTP